MRISDWSSDVCSSDLTAADDEHVAEGVRLFVGVGVGLAARPAQPGGPPDRRLVEPLPERGGPHEGLVVEAGDDERRERRIDRAEIEGERGPAILARDRKSTRLNSSH